MQLPETGLQPRRHRGRRQIEPEEVQRDIEQPSPVRGVRVHQPTTSQSQGAGRVPGLMTSAMCQVWPLRHSR